MDMETITEFIKICPDCKQEDKGLTVLCNFHSIVVEKDLTKHVKNILNNFERSTKHATPDQSK